MYALTTLGGLSAFSHLLCIHLSLTLPPTYCFWPSVLALSGLTAYYQSVSSASLVETVLSVLECGDGRDDSTQEFEAASPGCIQFGVGVRSGQEDN